MPDKPAKGDSILITFDSLEARRNKIAVVGLGYVGLPLAVHLAAFFDVVGFDLKTERIQELQSGFDRTLEVPASQLGEAGLVYTDKPKDLADCRLMIVAVPTPIPGESGIGTKAVSCRLGWICHGAHHHPAAGSA